MTLNNLERHNGRFVVFIMVSGKQGRIQGGGYFWQSQFYFFYIVYNV